MIGLFDRLLAPLLRQLDPEHAHSLAVRMLKHAPLRRPARDDPRLAVRAFGLDFPNPVGIAPGFDKHGEVPDALLRLGFGFVEVGTVTPLPQAGNPRPRLFRLDADQAIINRLGFNSAGADAVFERLAAHANPVPGRSSSNGGIVGINVGANKDAPSRIADYVQLIDRFAAVASYVAVNVSSPNTPGLRTMQQAAVLDDLLARVLDARERAYCVVSAADRPANTSAGATPVLLKIAPDLSLSDLDDIVGVARSRRIDGMIVGNTTVGRPRGLRETATAKEAGGLSGRPLFTLATRMLAETFVRVEGVFPLIGAGGVDSGAAALAKIRAGAHLVQIYSALAFRGVGLVGEIKSALVAAMERGRADNLAGFVGVDAAAVTAAPWPD